MTFHELATLGCRLPVKPNGLHGEACDVGPSTQRHLTHAFAVVVILVSVVGCSKGGPETQSGNAKANHTAPASSLVPAPVPVDLGCLPPGCVGRAELSVRNVGRASQTLARVDCSCPCVRVVGLPLSIPAGTTAALVVTFDPSEEPDFRGALAVRLRGLGDSDVELFRADVLVRVDASCVSQAEKEAVGRQGRAGQEPGGIGSFPANKPAPGGRRAIR
jgi:hypothetical protein